MNRKDLLELKKLQILVTVPVKVKLKLLKNNGYREIDAKQFTYVIKWKDILRYYRKQ